MVFRSIHIALSVALISAAVSVTPTGPVLAQAEQERAISLALADMLQSARGVIGSYQDRINAAEPTDKGLTGDYILREAMAAFMAKGNPAPADFQDEKLRRLLDAQAAAIVEIIDENQATINREGVEFKGFVPAVFARLVNERFLEKVGNEATVKVTAPLSLVRNRKARPDEWESGVIESTLMSTDWSTGAVYEEAASVDGREAYRVLVPEYYSEGCMACHGAPAGEIDVTGYPKEGGTVGQLGGVISITLFR